MLGVENQLHCRQWAMFWLTDKAKEVIKMKEYFKGKYRFKVRQY